MAVITRVYMITILILLLLNCLPFHRIYIILLLVLQKC